MQIAFFSDLSDSGNIHPIEQKFHFAFVDPSEKSTLSRKHKWNQETQHIAQNYTGRTWKKWETSTDIF